MEQEDTQRERERLEFAEDNNRLQRQRVREIQHEHSALIQGIETCDRQSIALGLEIVRTKTSEIDIVGIADRFDGSRRAAGQVAIDLIRAKHAVSDIADLVQALFMCPAEPALPRCIRLTDDDASIALFLQKHRTRQPAAALILIKLQNLAPDAGPWSAFQIKALAGVTSQPIERLLNEGLLVAAEGNGHS